MCEFLSVLHMMIKGIKKGRDRSLYSMYKKKKNLPFWQILFYVEKQKAIMNLKI